MITAAIVAAAYLAIGFWFQRQFEIPSVVDRAIVLFGWLLIVAIIGVLELRDRIRTDHIPR